jgi:hypothetical protein
MKSKYSQSVTGYIYDLKYYIFVISELIRGSSSCKNQCNSSAVRKFTF